MKITVSQLRRIIAEEVKRVMSENVEERVAKVLGILRNYAVEFARGGRSNKIFKEELEAKGITQADLKLVQAAFAQGQYDSERYYIGFETQDDKKTIAVVVEDPDYV